MTKRVTSPGPRRAGVSCNAQDSVGCPCGDGWLMSRFTCLSVRFVCSSCGARFELGDLATSLSPEAFERLAQRVAGRFSDRV